jgi:hypothetical protein
MPAVETVLYTATAGAAAAFPQALPPVNGDPTQVRAFSTTDWAKMIGLVYSAGGGQKIRVTSPMLHDPNTGLTFQPADVPSSWLLGGEVGVSLTPSDTLTFQGGIAAAGTMIAAAVNYYSNLPGTSARLHSWGDISGIIKFIKSVEVDLAAVAAGTWTDTLITNTENQLHADSDYAVLGYQTTAAIDVVGVKGQETGNLRVCGPGPTSTLDITRYFVEISNQFGIPFIPVFNANNKNAFYVSVANHAAIGAGAQSVYLILAELTQTVSP